SALAELGYQLVIVPSDLQRAAIHAMKKTLVELQRSGDSHAMANELTSFSERELIIQTAKFLELDDL
ncbi:hypothetical protein NK362_25650, partial [Salmonella enterica]|uniref:hypothetical protein n=1 Tax=Salmonella enterica TaxID=28901 RepID=UPI0022B6A210